MKDAIRVILIDPTDDSRLALLRVISEIGELWLAEACSAYQGSAKRVAEINPDLTIVVIDSNPEQAIALIQSLIQIKPNAIILPASKTHDTATILRVIRAGAREFLSLPASHGEVLESVNRLIVRREEKDSESDRGPQV